MAHKDKGGYAKKRLPDHQLNPGIAKAVKQASSEGKITCAAAFKVASKIKVTPGEVGITIDLLEIPIVKCQLWLFGYGSSDKGIKTAETISTALEAAIKEALVKGKLPCASAWEIAAKLKMAKGEIASACETLKTKISSCQLGAF